MLLSIIAAYAPLALASIIPPKSFTEQSFACDLPPPLDPAADKLPSAHTLFGSSAALQAQIRRHQALVRVPTICFDDLGPFDTDPRWKPFHDFHDVLAETFPMIHGQFTREKVNTFGLLYTLQGRDTSLKPVMLAAHQDVVPVADPTTWTYPPFDAVYDGKWLWGRGASDDKNSMTALLSAVEGLLAQGWTPRRTVLLAFGFDEECSGRKGAGTISQVLRERYGDDSLAIVLDEGGMGLQQFDGGEEGSVLYALPAVMEKGHVDIWFTLHVQGGHSSTPFPHTGVGIMAEMVQALEAHPYEPVLTTESPLYKHYLCQARYSPSAEPKITQLVKEGDLSALASVLAAKDRSTHYRLATSQAVDYIGGGQKINAMPEVITLGVNYRVAMQDSIGEVMKNVVEYTSPVAKAYGVEVVAFKDDDEYSAFVAGEEPQQELEPLYEVDYNATLVLTASQKTQVAPISPSDDEVWDVFAGTIRQSFAYEGGMVVPVGELMTGNTDTRHYLGKLSCLWRRQFYMWIRS